MVKFKRISNILPPPWNVYTANEKCPPRVLYHSCRYLQCRRGAYRFTSGRRRRHIITSWWRWVQASAAKHIRHIHGCRTAVGRQVRGGYESVFAVQGRLIPVLHVQSCIVPAVTISGELLPDHGCITVLLKCCRAEDLLGGWSLVGKCSRCHHNLFSTSCGPFRFCIGGGASTAENALRTHPHPLQRVCNTLRRSRSALTSSYYIYMVYCIICDDVRHQISRGRSWPPPHTIQT